MPAISIYFPSLSVVTIASPLSLLHPPHMFRSYFRFGCTNNNVTRSMICAFPFFWQYARDMHEHASEHEANRKLPSSQRRGPKTATKPIDANGAEHLAQFEVPRDGGAGPAGPI